MLVRRPLVVWFLFISAWALTAGKVTPWQPVGEPRRNLWTISYPKDAEVSFGSGTHFFHVGIVEKKSPHEQTLWINGSYVWKGPCCANRVVVDRAGNWLMVWLAAPPSQRPSEIWINGERSEPGGFATNPRQDDFVWTRTVGDRQCVMRISGTIGCAAKIVSIAWVQSGIYWIEETVKAWRVHPPAGNVREFPLPPGKGVAPHFDDFGAVWWVVEGNLFSERSPAKPVLSSKENWKQAGFFRPWDLFYREIPAGRKGFLLRRDAPAHTGFLPWNRARPFYRDFEPFPVERRGDAEYALVCGAGVESVRMATFPAKASGMFPGHLWLLGVPEGKDSTAIFYDCSKTPPDRAEMPILQISTDTQLARSVWLGGTPSPFRFVRSVRRGSYRPVDYYMAAPPRRPRMGLAGAGRSSGRGPGLFECLARGPALLGRLVAMAQGSQRPHRVVGGGAARFLRDDENS